MDFHTETHIKKSRQPHRCECTGVVIPVGAPYVRQSGRFDGEFYDDCLHPGIVEMWNRRNAAVWKGGGDGLHMSDLMNDIFECDDDSLRDAITFHAIRPHPELAKMIENLTQPTL